MPADTPDQRVHQGNITALRGIRSAEAARMLGPLDATGLPERAREWSANGADSANVRALAGSDLASDGVRLTLLNSIVAEFDLGFATQQDARRFQAEEIMRSRQFGQDATVQIYALSNGYTDELVQRLHRVIARLIHR